MNVPTLFESMMALHERLNLPPVDCMAGKVWKRQVDANWFICLNGNGDIVGDGPDEWKVPIHPYACAVWHNGWYGGEFDRRGGVLCAGAVANEDALIRAMSES